MDPVDPVIDADLEGAAAADVPAEDEAAVDAADATEADSTAKPKWTHPSIGRWALFAAIAIGVVVVDQLVKAWVVGNLAIGDGFQLIGDLVRIIHWRNSGILFGMLPQSAGAFAIVSLVVVGVIVFYHAKAGRGLVVTIALGLLLGGAIGNLIDRLHYGLRRRLRRHGHRHLAVLYVQRCRCGDLDGDRAAGGDGGVPGNW